MTEFDALELMRSAIGTAIGLSAPAVAGALAVGALIAFLQAITQIQEATLTFVPKIVVILLVTVLSSRSIGSQIHTFTELVYSRIETGFD